MQGIEGLNEADFYRNLWQVAADYDSLSAEVSRGVNNKKLLAHPPYEYQQFAMKQITEDILMFAAAYRDFRGMDRMLEDSLNLGYNMSRLILAGSNVGTAGRRLPDLESMVGVRGTIYTKATQLAFGDLSTLHNISLIGVNAIGLRLLEEDKVDPSSHRQVQRAGLLAVSLVLVNTDDQAEAVFRSMSV
jgi:hypothetical protein